MRQRWRLTVPALLSLVTTLALAGPTGTANAAPSRTPAGTHSSGLVNPQDNWWVCSPSNTLNCNNTDPYTTGCGNTQVRRQSINGYQNGNTWQLNLWYSTACRTVWGRLVLLSGTNRCQACILSVSAMRNYQTVESASVGSTNGTIYSGAWTDQILLPCTSPSTLAYVDLWDYYTGGDGSTYGWVSC